MNGWDVKVKLLNLERNVIIPEGLTFNDLSEIMNILFAFDGYHNFCFYIGDLTLYGGESVDSYFEDNLSIVYHYDFGNCWKVNISVNENVEYNNSFTLLKDYAGKYVFDEDDIRIKSKFNPVSAQKKLMGIKAYNFKAWDIKVRCENSWCDLYIPENTDFSDLEDIIQLIFKKDISFDFTDGELHENSVFYSKNYEFKIEVKNLVRYDKDYPFIKRVKGDFDLDNWNKTPEIIFKKDIDLNQSSLDDYF